ncbi:potassium transporter Trk [Agromyces intestinalis]|uniref:Potassium transporter Trk n=1 Tax=Agromyces intestinalis TaxID=2592652 RepID=A0A5C1YMX3_9MICO|nr:potassium transporter Trk [Agromyces intestinalis]
MTDETVEVRRAPRYGAFLLAGGVVGALVALILTFAFPENDQFDRGQVFGFLLLALGAVGVGIGALVALLIDRSLSRRGGRAIVEHESTHRTD